MLFWKKSKKKYKPLDCFNSIKELPIVRWFDIHETGDLRALLKEDREINQEEFGKLKEVWNKIYNEYIDKFGLSQEFLDALRDEVYIAELKAQYVITNQLHYKTLIEVEEQKLESAKHEMKKPDDLELILASMSKYYGFMLDSKELTTEQYFSYIESIKRNARSNKK